MTILSSNRPLLTRFRQGDPAALETVYRAYVDAVTDAVRRGLVLLDGRRVAGVPAHDVADLVQEVFTRAFCAHARQAYDGLRSYRPYLLTICRNLMADWLRQRGREVLTDGQWETILQDPAADDSAAEPWADPAVLETVQRYVASLEAPLAAVYEQRYKKGTSQAAAAQALGVSRQQLRTLEKRIRSGLAAALGRF